MDYTRTELAGNQARLITIPTPNSRSTTVMVMAKVGSRYESRAQNGLAHFMEHMFFKGAQRYPDAMAVASAIDSIGGVFNAFTSEEKVAYFVKLSAAKRELAYDLLSDMIYNSKFDPAEIERERGVIIEEIRMYNDDPMSKVQIDFKRRLFGDQPLGWDIAGPEENIRAFDRADFVRFNEKYYPPSNLAVVVAGALDHSVELDAVERWFGARSAPSVIPSGTQGAPFRADLVEPTKTTLTRRPIEQAHIVLGFLTGGIEDEDQSALKVLSNILGGSMSSRLFHQIRERRGLAYYISSGLSAYSDVGAFRISAGVNLEKIQEALEAIGDQIEKIKSDPVDQAELEKGKENIKGRLDLSMEDSMTIASLFATGEIVRSKIETPDQIVRKIEAVSSADLARVAKKYLRGDRMKMALLGELDDVDRYEKAISISN